MTAVVTRHGPPGGRRLVRGSHSLVDLGDRGVSDELGAVVVPSWQGPVAAPGRGRMGDQPGGAVSGISPGSAGGSWSSRIGAGARVSVRPRSRAEVTGADGPGGHHQRGVPGDRRIEADLGLVQPEAALSRAEFLSY